VISHPCDVAPTVTTSGSNGYATFRRALRRASPQLARSLPWIGHPDPWAVLVSEFMLQQTQSSRVIEPWERFLEALPTPTACANAPLAIVLRLWSGLGYNRRAKALHDTARCIRDQFGGDVPNDVAQLRSLPGVGEYTANPIASFAFSRRVAVLDTNVGRVVARAVANRSLKPSEARLIADALLPRSNVAAFNQALLDLGATFCKAVPRCVECPVAATCRWQHEGGLDPAPKSAGVSRPQSKFEGSDRQVRGRILMALRSTEQTATELKTRAATRESQHFAKILQSLIGDGLVEQVGGVVRLVGDE
jgi:A/G-specific adenine glycosylase